ncbi:MAG: 1-(5-phosphoribosyl)-5-((5-phosphoribosylamino)methylideneamino)imidazole-4-carboxamide isomerase, partial [Myxococcales bacterium]|nr:1-(5-phosphoribosyl)-5-((5-phosphoribosylamino)methylideneamino)imidazole-4-carboxamide isomerase [Myxococcales bacterium]
RVATDGWLDVSEKLAVDVAKELSVLPVAAVLYTDIDKDGTERGPNFAETARLARDGGLPVIASGGVGTLDHIRELTKSSADGVLGAIVGKALHEGRFSLSEAVAAAKG